MTDPKMNVFIVSVEDVELFVSLLAATKSRKDNVCTAMESLAVLVRLEDPELIDQTRQDLKSKDALLGNLIAVSSAETV